MKGKQHVDTISSMGVLAQTMQQLGHHDTSEALAREAQASQQGAARRLGAGLRLRARRAAPPVLVVVFAVVLVFFSF